MKKLTDKEIDALVKKYQNLSYQEIASEVNKVGYKVTGVLVSAPAVRSRYRKMKLPKKYGGTFAKTVAPEGFKEELYKFLLKNKKPYSLEALSDKYNCGISKIREAIESLKKDGKNFHTVESEIEISTEIKKTEPTKIDARHLVGTRVKVGFVTDNHMGSNYERMDVLNALYDRFASAGVTTVYNAGNCIDGEARFNKFDIHKYGMEKQCEYFAEAYPSRKGMTTYYITGDDHEGWYVQREGVNIGKFMEQKAHEHGRNDLVYLGHMEHDIVLKAPKGQAILRIVHPGGGSSYAYSYTSQKIVESYTPGEKPDIVFGGHYHKASYNFIRGVHFVQGGCTMNQSPFMRKKRLEAHIGGWIIEYQQGENGVIQSFQAEWIPFYGKDFYTQEDLWEYKY